MVRRWLSSLLIVLPLMGQNPNTAAFPGAVATDQDLFVYSNSATTFLTATMSAVATTMTVASTTTFRVPALVFVNNEVVAVCSKTATSFTVCSGGRAKDNTQATGHPTGTVVSVRPTAWYHNQLAAEVKALEAWADALSLAITGDVTSNTSTSVDGEIVLFNGTTGKSIKRATTTGVLKATSGVIAAAVGGTDYENPLTAGVGIARAVNTLSIDLGELVDNQTIFDGSQASRDITANLSAGDPTLRFSANKISLPTGNFEITSGTCTLGCYALTIQTQLTFGAINDLTCSTPQTVALAGSVTTDIVIPYRPPELAANVRVEAWVPASDLLRIQVCNESGASYTPPPSIAYGGRIVR